MTEEDIERRVDNMSETLELTKDQHSKVMSFEMENSTKMQLEREKNMGDRDAMRASMMKIRDERNKQYEEVLTEVQLVKFKEIQEQQRNQRRQQYEQGGGGQGGGSDSQGDRPPRGRSRDQGGN